MIYLIHFDEPYHHARHYLGFAEKDLPARLAQHRAGSGARILAVVGQTGIGWRVVRTWRGGRTLERRLKNRHNSAKLCPVCNPSPGITRHGGPELETGEIVRPGSENPARKERSAP